MVRRKIKISTEDAMKALVESTKRKDLSISEMEIEGEEVETREYKYQVGDTVFVRHYYDTTSSGYKNSPRILGGRWGKIEHTNMSLPNKDKEGRHYFVVSSEYGIGGWENEEDLELINSATSSK